MSLMSEVFILVTLIVRPRAVLTAEILFLRKQLAFYQEHQIAPKRLTNAARPSLVFCSRLCDWKVALMIVKPETLIRWHRQGFKLFWRWESRVGRPRLPENIRKLIVRMVKENPTWGQARVADELSLKLGIQVSPRTVRAYWPSESERPGPRRGSSQLSESLVRSFCAGQVWCQFCWRSRAGARVKARQADPSLTSFKVLLSAAEEKSAL
jgi:putative transposase